MFTASIELANRNLLNAHELSQVKESLSKCFHVLINNKDNSYITCPAAAVVY